MNNFGDYTFQGDVKIGNISANVQSVNGLMLVQSDNFIYKRICERSKFIQRGKLPPRRLIKKLVKAAMNDPHNVKGLIVLP